MRLGGRGRACFEPRGMATLEIMPCNTTWSDTCGDLIRAQATRTRDHQRQSTNKTRLEAVRAQTAVAEAVAARVSCVSWAPVNLCGSAPPLAARAGSILTSCASCLVTLVVVGANVARLREDSGDLTSAVLRGTVRRAHRDRPHSLTAHTGPRIRNRVCTAVQLYEHMFGF